MGGNTKIEGTAIRRFLSHGTVLGAVSFIAGAFFISFGADLKMILAAGAIGGFFLWAVTGNRNAPFFLFAVLTFIFLGGKSVERAENSAEFSDLWGKTISGKGVVRDDPSKGQFKQRIVVSILECEGSEKCKGEKVSLSIDRWKEVSFGDTVRFSCLFQKPENFSGEFDFRMYLAAKGIRSECREAFVEVLRGEKTVFAYMGSIRRSLEESVQRSIGQPYAALGNGLLFGGSDRLSEHLQELFSKTSMTHIVAVSGYNVAIVANILFLSGVFLGLWRRSATLAAIGGIALFVVFVGATPSAVRAGVMGSLLLVLLALGHPGGSFRALLFVGALMVANNPLILWYDTGFQLSFLATLGILFYVSIFLEMSSGGRRLSWLRDSIGMTLAAQVAVLPVILFSFHSFSLLSFAANIAILWTIPFATIGIFFVSLLGMVWDFLGFFAGIPARMILWYDIFVIERLARLGWGTIVWKEPSALFAVAWYGVFFSVAFWFFQKKRREAKKMCKKYQPLARDGGWEEKISEEIF